MKTTDDIRGEFLKRAKGIIGEASRREAAFRAGCREMSGYEGFTTFFSDFTIAELCGGAEAVRGTWRRAFAEWKKDHRHLTELALVLNHKIWELYETEPSLARVYDELWRRTDKYACTHLGDEGIAYYYKWTD